MLCTRFAQGGHAQAIKEHLGHSSITVTLDRYGHLFPDERQRLADALDAVYRRSGDLSADSSRTNGLPRAEREDPDYEELAP